MPEQQDVIVTTAAEECINKQNQCITVNTMLIFDSRMTDLLLVSANYMWMWNVCGESA